MGDIDIFRRFREFDLLRKTLFNRFFGLYIPPLPEKKKIGNKSNQFVEERRYFLNKFMRDCCQLPYLFESQEFMLFLRPPTDNIEKALEALPKRTTNDFMAVYRSWIPLQEGMNDIKTKQYEEAVHEFVKECKDIIEHLKKFKKQIKMIVPIKEQEVTYYKEFVDFLIKYEDINLRKQTADDPFTSLMLEAKTNTSFKDTLSTSLQQMRNPFIHVRNWVKGEIMDLDALLQAILRKEAVDGMKFKTITQLKQNRDTVDKMNTGKFTFKAMFKSQSGKTAETQNILSSISQEEKDIQNYDTIRQYLLVYLKEIAIPAFKNSKMNNYKRAMRLFSKWEIRNARRQQECWREFLGMLRAAEGEEAKAEEEQNAGENNEQ